MTGTRDRILAATTELFRRRGYNGTSLRDITTAAQATTGSLYHFFPGGKSDLAKTFITEAGASYQQLFEMIVDEAADPAEAICDFFDGAADVLEEGGFIDVCPVGTIAREVASSHDDLRLAADREFDGWIEAAASRFRAAGMAPSEAAEVATTIVAALEGGFLLARCRQNGELLRVTGRHMRALVLARLAETPVRPTP